MIPIKELKPIVECPKSGGWYLEHTLRRISVYFTWLLLHTSITGNQVSFLFILTYIAAGILFTSGDLWFNLWAALLLQVGYLLDCIDGEIARYRKDTSLTGSYLDKIAHVINHPFVFFCMSMGLYARYPSTVVIYIGFFAAYSCLLMECVYKFKFYSIIYIFLKHHEHIGQRYDSFAGGFAIAGKGKPPAKPPQGNPRTPRLATRIYQFVTLLNGYTAMMNVILVAVVFDLLKTRFVVLKQFPIDGLLLVLIFYAASQTVDWVLNLYLTVARRSIDTEYRNIVGSIAQIKIS